MSMHLRDFNGHCLLFSEGKWQEEDGQLLVSWASCRYCYYVIFVADVLCIVSTIQIYKLSRLVYKGLDTTFLSTFVEAVGCGLMCLMSLLAAVFVTLGFITWCQNIMQRFPSCEVAAGQDIDKKDAIITTHYYIEMRITQFGVWGAFASWVGLAVFSTLKLCRYHQFENIRVSMYRERQRLVNEGSPVTQQGRSTPPIESIND